MKLNFKKLIIIILLPLVLAGCSISVKTKSGNDGGVYISNDKGENWSQISMVYRVSEIVKTFNNVDLTAMVIDPIDNKAIYIATHDQGMFYTFDGGIGWQQTLENKGRINAIAISPNESCIIYVAIANRVYKSTDCNRHWTYQFIESRADPNNQITDLAIDNYDSNIIYAGTSGKGLFRSADGGFSWQVVNFFDDRIARVLIEPQNTNIIYIATQAKGIYKTTDKGETWTGVFTEEIKEEYANLLIYRDLILDPTTANSLLYASQYGLFRSSDAGETWQNLKLLTPPNTTAIYSLAINPQDGQEIYYGIDTVLYRSVDGGENWVTRGLPTTRAAKFIFIDPEEPNRIYLGVKKITN